MESPIETLINKHDDIARTYRHALRSGASESDLNKIIEKYNSYFVAIQLLQSHIDVRYKFSKFVRTQSGLSNRYTFMHGHLKNIIK